MREAEYTRQQRRKALQPFCYDFLERRAGKHEIEQPQAFFAFSADEAQERREIKHSLAFKSKLNYPLRVHGA